MSCGCHNFPHCEHVHQHGTHSHGRHKSSCNPCGDPATNTAACENLPSQIDNFTKQFFGEVTKTEVDGVVSWSLPCNLDVGLPANPRLEGEGVGCYLLRLMENGIVGLVGPEGDTGAAGTDGNNAYTVTLASFVQPSSGAPNTSVFTLANPAIVDGLTIFIATSGYYFVNATDGNGTLFLTLVQAASGAPAVITAGKLVIAAGPQGVAVTGATGPQGNPGPTGSPGVSFTTTNGQYAGGAVAGTDFPLTVLNTPVNFVATTAEVTLPEAGKYKLTATIPVEGQPTIVPTDELSFLLVDTNLFSAVSFSEQLISNVADGQRAQVIINVDYVVPASRTVQIWGKCTTAGAANVVANNTMLNFVRIA